MDDDLDAAPFLRLAPTQPLRPIHRFQHLYVWFLLAFFPLKWALYDDFRSLARQRVGFRPVPRPRGYDLALFVLGKLVFVSWAIVIPISLHPLGPMVLTFGLVSTVSGVVLATVFQLAHCVEEAEHHPTPADQRLGTSWAEHQLATTVDFAPDNALLCWYLGGLNHQVEHHLFPKVSHVHYRRLHPIIKQVCKENGVRHRTNPTLIQAIASHVRFLKRMGKLAATQA